MKFDAFGTLTD